MSCQKCEELLLDYIEGTLTPEEKQEFRLHLENCQICQQALEQQRKILNMLEQEIDRMEIPHDFMEQVEERLYQQPPKRRRKSFGWRIVAVAVALGILLFSTDLTTGMMNGVLQWWQSISGTQQANGDQNDIVEPGEPLSLTAEDQNVRITFTWIEADEFQTDLYYIVEDLNYMEKYDLIFKGEGLNFTNGYMIWNGQGHAKGEPPILGYEQIDKEEPYFIHKGKLSLPPITPTSGNIELSITSLNRLSSEANPLDPQNPFAITERDAVTGNWKIEIPVTKKETREYQINQVVDIDSIPVTLETLKVGSTTTILNYSYQHENPNVSIFVEKLESEGESYYLNPFTSGGGGFTSLGGGSHRREARFESIAGQSIDELNIHFGSIVRSVDLEEQYPIDLEQPFPQTFEYLGFLFSIDQVEIGSTAAIVVNMPEHPDRIFDDVNFNFKTNLDGSNITLGHGYSDKQYYIEDKWGNRINSIEDLLAAPLVSPSSIKFVTTKVQLDLYDLYPAGTKQEIIPTHLIITGYQQTEFLDDIVTIQLK